MLPIQAASPFASQLGSDSLAATSQLNQAQSVQNKKSHADKPNAEKEAFTDFVGQTFFGQLIASMRASVKQSSMFHGGRGEEVFQGQLDQMLSEKMSQASAKDFAEPMYNLFTLQRK